MSRPTASAFRNPFLWLTGIVRATLRCRPALRVYEWIDEHVSIPVITGSPNPGPLKTDRFPIYRGLYDLIQQPHVHFFTFCASVRVGKTLLSICVVLWWIAEKFGPVVWLDPTRKSAIKFSRTELDPYMRECPPVWDLAVVSKTTWTALEKTFRGKFMRLIGSGAEAEMHGFQAALIVLNEADRLRQCIDRDAASWDKIIARSNQFEHIRLVIRNSTPDDEQKHIWPEFRKGSQHYCYLPCPHCRAPQRLSFFREEKEVPFDEQLQPLPAGSTRTERTGFVRFEQFARHENRETTPGQSEQVKVGYDIEAVKLGATYACGACDRDIEQAELNQMLAGYQWVAHNPGAPRDHISAHLSALYSPWQTWGVLAGKFLAARGSRSKLREFYNLDLGLPLPAYATHIKEDDLDRAARRAPTPYIRGQLPLEPCILTMAVDVGGMASGNFWWSIRAWGILWDVPGQPAWSALIDWGPAVSWSQIEEFAGLAPLPGNGPEKYNEYIWRDPETGIATRYRVTAALCDSGYEAKEDKNVYDFCQRHSSVFSPSKGGGQAHLRGNTIRTSPVHGETLDLVWYWDEWFKQALYYHCIKEGKTLWFVPTNLDEEYREHLTAEYTEQDKDGKLVWRRKGDNHLADTEKLHEVLRDSIEETLEEIRALREAEEAPKA